MADIGIMGGTFDPIHNGHLMLGRQAYEEYGLDFIWFMPSGQPPHKKNRAVTDKADRCAMVRLAVRGQPGFRFSDFEVSREGNTYTARTLALLKEAYPDHTFHYIIGADSLYEIETWYHPESVLTKVPLLVAGRAYNREHAVLSEQIAYLTQKYDASIRVLHCRETDISSEAIRKAAGEGQSIRGFVPEAVEAYIRSRNLYTTQRADEK